MNAWLQVIYFLGIWPARLLARLRGRDPLGLRGTVPATEGWVPVAARSGSQGYFVDDATGESTPARSESAAAWPLMLLFRLARRYAPQPSTRAERGSQRGESEIPDEIYTLW